MREIWVSDKPDRIPTVNQLEQAISNLGYNRRDAKWYGLRIVDNVKTVVLLGQSTEANHDRLHSMVSAADHAATIPGCYPVTGPDGNWELAPIPTPGGGVDNSTRLIEGSVLWLELLSFLVTDTQYKIWGQLYTTNAIEVELDASDPDNDRLDMICVNTSEEVIILKGVAAANPAAPIPDPYTQLELTTILVKAGATAPEITAVQVYDENIEWTTSNLISGPETTSCDFESIVDPVVNTKHILITKTGDDGIKKLEIYFNGPDTVLGEDANLSFRLKSSTAWLDSSAIEIVLKLNGDQVGNSVLLVGNNFGNNSTMPAWNTIVIPAANFGATGLTIDEIDLRFSYTYWFDNSNTISIDDMKLQFGATVTPPVVVGSEIIIPELKIHATNTRVLTGSFRVRDYLMGRWHQVNEEFLNHNPEIWVFRYNSNRKSLKNTPPVTGTNLITDGAFNTGTGWNPVGGYISGGFFNCLDTFLFGTDLLIYTTALTAGKYYRVKFDMAYHTMGTVRLVFCGHYPPSLHANTNGTYTAYIYVPAGNVDNTLRFQVGSETDNSCYFSIDNVEVLEMQPDWTQKIVKKVKHEPHFNGSKYPGSAWYTGSITCVCAEIEAQGRKTEFPFSEIVNADISGNIFEIPIDAWDYIWIDIEGIGNTVLSDDADFNAGAIEYAGGGKSISFAFAIVIDNPDPAAANPKIIGPMSEYFIMKMLPGTYGTRVVYQKKSGHRIL